MNLGVVSWWYLLIVYEAADKVIESYRASFGVL